MSEDLSLQSSDAHYFLCFVDRASLYNWC